MVFLKWEKGRQKNRKKMILKQILNLIIPSATLPHPDSFPSPKTIKQPFFIFTKRTTRYHLFHHNHPPYSLLYRQRPWRDQRVSWPLAKWSPLGDCRRSPAHHRRPAIIRRRHRHHFVRHHRSWANHHHHSPSPPQPLFWSTKPPSTPPALSDDDPWFPMQVNILQNITVVTTPTVAIIHQSDSLIISRTSGWYWCF